MMKMIKTLKRLAVDTNTTMISETDPQK